MTAKIVRVMKNKIKTSIKILRIKLKLKIQNMMRMDFKLLKNDV
jgi:hypothetical protein